MGVSLLALITPFLTRLLPPPYPALPRPPAIAFDRDEWIKRGASTSKQDRSPFLPNLMRNGVVKGVTHDYVHHLLGPPDWHFGHTDDSPATDRYRIKISRDGEFYLEIEYDRANRVTSRMTKLEAVSPRYFPAPHEIPSIWYKALDRSKHTRKKPVSVSVGDRVNVQQAVMALHFGTTPAPLPIGAYVIRHRTDAFLILVPVQKTEGGFQEYDLPRWVHTEILSTDLLEVIPPMP